MNEPSAIRPHRRVIVTGPNDMTKEEREKLRAKFRAEKAILDAKRRQLAEKATAAMKLDEDKPL